MPRRRTAAECPSYSSTQRVSLRADCVWIIEAGHADVWVTTTRESERVGRRQYLGRASSGDALPAPDTDELYLDALSDGSLRLATVEWPAFLTRVAEPHTSDAYQRGIEWWIERLAALAGDGRRGQCALHSPGERLQTSQAVHIHPREGVMWAHMVAGASLVCGDPALRIEAGGLAPVSPRAWLAIEPFSEVVLLSTADLVEAHRIEAALHAARALWTAGIPHALEKAVQAEQARQRTRIADTRRDLADAFGRIASSYGQKVHAAPPPEAAGESTEEEALVAACRAVATSLDVPVTTTAAVGGRSTREALERIALGWGIRMRQVVLRDRWWRKDQGPLLAFTREGKKPVALIPQGTAKYRVVDPLGGVRVVTSEVAEEIATTVFTFYRTLPAAAVTWRDLVRTGFHGCGRDLLAIAVIGAAGGVLAATQPVAVGVLVNAILPSADRSQLGPWLFLILVCAAAGALLQIARGVASARLEARVGSALPAAVWARLLSLPVSFFRNYSAGALAVRAMGIDTIRQAMSGATLRGLLGGVFSVFNFILLFHYHFIAATFACLLLLILIGVTLVIARMQLQEQRAISQLRAKTSGIVLQLLTGIAKLRVGGAEVRAFSVWARLFSEQRRRFFKYRVISNLLVVFNTVFPVLANVVLFTVLVQHAEHGSLRTGDVIAFMVAFGACVSAALSMAAAMIAFMSVMPYYEMAQPILQTLPEVTSGERDPGKLAGEISADRLVFRYGADGAPVLHDVSFRIEARQFVAFVGPTGSGKSTILRLLLGFETPQSGAVYVDGLDLQGLDIRAVRRQIGVVLQSGRLIPGDIYSNIVGSTSATLDQVWNAARLVGLDEDIKAMPMGMHTVVTDGGGTLSGGQRQRVMIARAIVHRPRILLFDEATSSLDNRTQAIVSRSLEQLQATRIVIAHRLSTIVNADRIFVVVGGRIVQSGTYQELVGQPGFFAELARRQVA